MSDIWLAAKGLAAIQHIKGQGWRLVECQETVGTTEIVSTLEHQAVLEQMLEEESKPHYRPGTGHLHYLLSTPFRYPPLEYGSRFGGNFEPSLFYGGTSVDVTLAESAFYRFFFFHDMEVPPPDGMLKTQHTLFKFTYQTDLGVKLHHPPFDVYREALTHPADYGATQKIGALMRADGVEAFEYLSSRDVNGGVNVALFNEKPLTCKKPPDVQSCLCQVNPKEVFFSIKRKITNFPIEQFLIDGVLPRPAH